MKTVTDRRGTALGALAPLLALAVGLGAPETGSAQERTLLPPEDRALDVDLTPVFSVGAIDGADWESFGEVTSARFGPDGNLYVLDGQAYRVLVISPEGELIREIGSQGEGPGEFRMPGGMDVLDDGTIVVFDRMARNFSFLRPDGTYVRSVVTDLIAEGMPMGTTRAAGDVVLSEFRGMDVDTGNPERDPKDGGNIFIRPVMREGETAPVAVLANPGSRASFTSRPDEQNISVGGAPAFTPPIDWDVMPDGRLAWIEGPRWTVKVAGRDGAVRTFERPMPPRPVTERDRNDERARRLEALESTGVGAPMRVEEVNGQRTVTRDTDMGRRMIQNLEFAEVVPVLAGIAVDPAGRIWVLRNGPRVGAPGTVDVVTADGDYLGSFESDVLPTAFARDGRAAFVRTGEYGVQTIEVVRVSM